MKKGNIQRYPWIASWHRPITLMHNIILDKYPIPSSFFSQAPQLGQHECIPAHSPIRESRPYFITTSSLAHTSTSIQKELPLLEASKHKNLVHNKWVVSKQGCDLVHLLRFNNDKRSCSIAKRTTHDHGPIFKEPIHKFSMFVPICLFAYCLARCPGCAWSP